MEHVVPARLRSKQAGPRLLGQREDRLCHRRERERQQCALETAKEREARLARQRVRDGARCAAQSVAVSDSVSRERARRLSVQTPEVRDAHLRRVRMNQQCGLDCLCNIAKTDEIDGTSFHGREKWGRVWSVLCVACE